MQAPTAICGFRPDRILAPLGRFTKKDFGTAAARPNDPLKLLRLSFGNLSAAMARARAVKPLDRLLNGRVVRATRNDQAPIRSAIFRFRWMDAQANEPLARVEPGITQAIIDVDRKREPVLAIASITEAAFISYRPREDDGVLVRRFAGRLGATPRERADGSLATIPISTIAALTGLEAERDFHRLLAGETRVPPDVVEGIWIFW
ncbi:MAG: hypothetical protein IBJ15_00075 [Alphaproteobacteria bacterium]|nr:hypothetical protein [Alphaproteobacteria bacterium]